MRMPHKCHGNAGKCPTRSHQVWEVPINELDRRDDPTYDERLSGCHLVSSCSNIYEKEQFARLLRHNFNRHYQTNKAPLSLSFDAAWLKVNKGFTKVLSDWVAEILEQHNDVYFVSARQVLFLNSNLRNRHKRTFKQQIYKSSKIKWKGNNLEQLLRGCCSDTRYC